MVIPCVKANVCCPPQTACTTGLRFGRPTNLKDDRAFRCTVALYLKSVPNIT